MINKSDYNKVVLKFVFEWKIVLVSDSFWLEIILRKFYGVSSKMQLMECDV